LPRPGGGGRTPAISGFSAGFFRCAAAFFTDADFRRFGGLRAVRDFLEMPILRIL
jgi:hypothetical protein